MLFRSANAFVGNCGYFLQSSGRFVQLAEDFNYYTSRYLLNGGIAPTGDNGSTPGMALKAGREYGVCLESTWPINTDPSVFNSQPSAAAYAEAANYKVQNYQRINNPNNPPIWFNSDNWWISILYALAKGYPVNIAFNVGQMLDTLQGDTVYQPIGNTNAWIGGHDVMIVGYTMTNGDMSTLKLLCRNSWGTSWGDKGHFWMAPSVLTADVFSAYVQLDFAGITKIGTDQTTYMAAPDASSTMQYVVDYVFKNKFGRKPLPAGEQFWSSAVSTWLISAILAEAAPADQAYLAAHPVSTPPVFSDAATISQVVSKVFETYFGREPLATGASYWAARALTQFSAGIVASAGPRDRAFMYDNNIV